MSFPVILLPPTASGPPARRVVAVAASAGGPAALAHVLSRLPAELPAAVLVVQHTSLLAERLNRLCPLRVREARHGDSLVAGDVLVAPGGSHLRVVLLRAAGVALLDQGAAVNNHRTSADVLFESVARAFGARAVGVMLTGMGEDGAAGLLALHEAGGRTLAQDEPSSVVFGMPRAAIRRGAVDHVLPLDDISEAVLREAARPETPPPSATNRGQMVPPRTRL